MRGTRALCSATLALVTLLAGPSAGRSSDRWSGAWGYAPAPPAALPPPARAAGTFRYRIRVTQGGSALTIRFSSPEGALPLVIRSASIAHADAHGSFEPKGRATPIRFSKRNGVQIEANTSLTSDAVPIAVRSGADLIVTVVTGAPTTDIANNAGFLTQYSPGDGGPSVVSKSRPLFSLVNVRNPQAPCTIVTLGDSITEGAITSEPLWRGWPGRLAKRLIQHAPERHCGVVNMGLSGNRLLVAGRGPSAVDRMARDVFSVPGVSHLIVLIGINDIQHSKETPISASDLISGYLRIIQKARARGIKVVGGTITPALGSRYVDSSLEWLRFDTNRWIRDTRGFDGVIDFEAALSTRNSLPTLRPEFDSGDKLHSNDAGHAAMADAIPLGLFD